MPYWIRHGLEGFFCPPWKWECVFAMLDMKNGLQFGYGQSKHVVYIGWSMAPVQRTARGRPSISNAHHHSGTRMSRQQVCFLLLCLRLLIGKRFISV